MLLGILGGMYLFELQLSGKNKKTVSSLEKYAESLPEYNTKPHCLSEYVFDADRDHSQMHHHIYVCVYICIVVI